MSRVTSRPLVAMASLLLVTVALAADEPPFTPYERLQVEQMAAHFQSVCLDVGEEQKRETPLIDPTGGAMAAETKRFMDEVQNSYCECVGDSIRRDMTPTLLRDGSPQQNYEFRKTAVKACGARSFKQEWPKTCPLIVKVLTAAGARPDKLDQWMSETCTCLQPRVDAITADNWGEVLQQYRIDNSNLQAHPETPTAPSKYSILGEMMVCAQQGARHLNGDSDHQK